MNPRIESTLFTRGMIAVVSIILASASVSAIAAPAERPLLMEGKKTIYQRVLTTPGCKLLAAPGAKAGEETPVFSRFYVYQRKQQASKEWLEVGPGTQGTRAGWLDAACAVDWKMQLTLAFTNSAGRDPLLFFRERSSLEKIIDAEKPTALVKPLHEKLAKNQHDVNVLAREPEYTVDIQKNFYLLPILEAEEAMSEAGFRMRLLNVASVSAPQAKGADDDKLLANDGKNADSDQNSIKGFSAAIVFVIDSTISMDPYIDRTRDAVRKIYEHIEKEKLNDKVKFGLVAFRSSVKAVPGLEYTSKIFVDPTKVVSADDFLAKVKDLQASKVSSSVYDEDSYAGVMDALNNIEWSEFGGRYVVLITDAGAINGNDKLSSTGLDAEQVRLEAAHRGVALYALHLKTPSGTKNHKSAEAQYRELAHNAFLNKPLYYPVDAGNVKVFGDTIDMLAGAIASQVKLSHQGEMAVGSALAADADYGKKQEPADKDGSMQQDTALLGYAMQLAYLGDVTGAKAPPVFKAWVSDRDLIDQRVPTTEVRVLMTKSELSDLNDVVKQIAQASNEGLLSPTDMFSRLRSVAAAMGRDASQIQGADAKKLADMGLLGEYLDGLPYLSDVLSLDEETWKSLSISQQQQFIRRLNNKLHLYQVYNDDVDRWVSLAPGSDPRDYVYPVPLEAMP